MQVEIRLFATLKDRAGRPRIAVEAVEPVTVATLLAATAAACPELAPTLGVALVAVNRAFADPGTPVQAGDEVALFPPVSGGNHDDDNHAVERPAYFAITTAKVDLNEIVAKVSRPDIGAVVTFTGAVRGQTQRSHLPAATLYLEYEAYAEMAQEKLAQIAQEIWERWPAVKGIAIVQRIGKLEVGEMTTLVACAAAHRDLGAFEAARYGIDRLKEIVPVWKKEVGRDHSLWLEGHYRPTAADNQ